MKKIEVKKKLSVVLAVYNEEKNIGTCLESAKDFAWEIVIVDGGSNDNTVNIAKGFGARIIQTKNLPNFHINKNIAIDAARGDWVLQLDADEIVTKELGVEIKRTISKNNEINGYWIPRRNFFLGRYLKKGGQYPDYTLRLYKKGLGRLPAKDVHEQAEVSGKVGYLKNDLLHLRDKKFADYLFRFGRYTDLMSHQMKDENLDINIITLINYVFFMPLFWFVKAYIRHKGFMDGFPGFVFAFFSSLRFAVGYWKYLKGD